MKKKWLSLLLAACVVVQTIIPAGADEYRGSEAEALAEAEVLEEVLIENQESQEEIGAEDLVSMDELVTDTIDEITNEAVNEEAQDAEDFADVDLIEDPEKEPDEEYYAGPVILEMEDSEQYAAADDQPKPYIMHSARTLTDPTKLSGVTYNNLIEMVMGSNFVSSFAQLDYNLHGEYSSVSFLAGYEKGLERDARMKVYADGSLLDEVVIDYKKTAKNYTYNVSGVKHFQIYMTSADYDTKYYGIANMHFTPSGTVKDHTYSSDEFFDMYNSGLRKNLTTKNEPFEMGGNTYNSGYTISVNGNWLGSTGQAGFNFQNHFRSISFDIGRMLGPLNDNILLTVETDDQVLVKEEKIGCSDIPKHYEFSLAGVSGFVITIKNHTYDTSTVGIGNIVLKSDGTPLGVVLSPTKATLKNDSRQTTLSARVYPSDATDKQVSYASDNEQVAAVDAGGVVTGLTKGTAKITASTSSGFSEVCTITSQVDAPIKTSVKLPETEIEAVVGKEVSIAAEIETTLPRDDKNFTWNLTGTDKFTWSDTVWKSVSGAKYTAAKKVNFKVPGLYEMKVTSSDGVESKVFVVVKPAKVKNVTYGTDACGSNNKANVGCKHRQMEIVWEKQDGVTGYQVEISTSSSFDREETETITVSKETHTNDKVRDRGKKMYVRVRSLHEKGGFHVEGEWSQTFTYEICKHVLVKDYWGIKNLPGASRKEIFDRIYFPAQAEALSGNWWSRLTLSGLPSAAGSTGRCFGFSISGNSVLYNQVPTIASLGDYASLYEINTWKDKTTACDLISYGQAISHLAVWSYRNTDAAHGSGVFDYFISHVRDYTRDPSAYMPTQFMVKHNDGTDGHTMVALDIMEETAGQLKIRVYDSNCPGSDQFMLINKSGSGWSYSGSSFSWNGGDSYFRVLGEEEVKDVEGRTNAFSNMYNGIMNNGNDRTQALYINWILSMTETGSDNEDENALYRYILTHGGTEIERVGGPAGTAKQHMFWIPRTSSGTITLPNVPAGCEVALFGRYNAVSAMPKSTMDVTFQEADNGNTKVITAEGSKGTVDTVFYTSDQNTGMTSVTKVELVCDNSSAEVQSNGTDIITSGTAQVKLECEEGYEDADGNLGDSTQSDVDLNTKREVVYKIELGGDNVRVSEDKDGDNVFENVVAEYKKHRHSYKRTLTAATSQADGKWENACTVCGKVLESAKIDRVNAVEFSVKDAVYNGTDQTPSVIVTDAAGIKLTEADYTVSWQGGKCVNAGSYTAVVTLKGNYSGTISKSFVIEKAQQVITTKTTGKTYKKKDLSKKKASFKLQASANGKLTYKSSNAKVVKVSKTGKVTVVKGAKKGTYKITITAAGNANYKAATKVVKVKVRG